MSGDFKSLNMVFGCLSGSSFARSPNASWLDKMSATESYEQYLTIKAQELGISAWAGTLEFGLTNEAPEKVHLFALHENLSTDSKNKKDVG